MVKSKVILIGPEETGKTLISNIILGTVKSFSSRYEPTKGVRIVEIEIPLSMYNSNESRFEIELWDCAGSSKYQSCWPVFQLEAEGVIFVYNLKVPHQISELELFYDYFVVQNGLSDDRCLLFINLREEIQEFMTLPNRFKEVKKKFINAASNPNLVKSEFINYAESLIKSREESKF